MKKIIISGFSHTGTTVLRSIIGHIPGVYEVKTECKYITTEIEKEALEAGKKAILIKTTEYTRAEDYEGYYRILLIRDPRYVFSSIFRRQGSFTEKQTFKEYKKRLNQWLNTLHSDTSINFRYEDLFENDFEAIRNALRKIKIRYSKRIFDNSNFTNLTGQIEQVPEERPEETDHGKFRVWQINQPLKMMNDPEKINLPDRTLKAIEGSELIKKAGY